MIYELIGPTKKESLSSYILIELSQLFYYKDWQKQIEIIVTYPLKRAAPGR